MMRTFLINLAKDTERLAVATQRLGGVGIGFERVDAVYAREMDTRAKWRAVSRLRWWCAMGRKATDGEIGCALSHQSIYQKMIDEQIPLACVLEDDVVVDKRMPMVLAEIEKQDFGDRPVVVLLSNHADWENKPGDGVCGFRTPEGEDDFVLKRTYWEMFAESYVITLAAAKALRKANCPLITPADLWMRWAENDIIELCHAFPTVCWQDKAGFATNTLPGMKLVRDMGRVKFVLHKAKRVVGKAMDSLLIKATGR